VVAGGGVALVRAIRFRLTSVLINDDFPTFERPAKTTSGNEAGG
jgi:hypothetical protein